MSNELNNLEVVSTFRKLLNSEERVLFENE